MEDLLKLELLPSQLAPLADLIKVRINVLEKELFDSRALLEKIQAMNNINSHSSPSRHTYYGGGPNISGVGGYSGTPNNGYNPHWTNIQKAKFIFVKKGRPLTTTEVVETILNEYEPDQKPNREKVVRNISSILGVNSKDDGILTRTRVNGDFLYELKKEKPPKTDGQENIVVADKNNAE